MKSLENNIKNCFDLIKLENTISQKVDNIFCEIFQNILNLLNNNQTEVPDLKLVFGGEDELIIYFNDINGNHMITIDSDGDTLVAFSSIKLSESWHKFYNESEVYTNLNIITKEFLNIK
jgi:hypothetical protein